MKIQQVLVPVDFSESSGQALMLALDLAEKFGSVIKAIHVWSPPTYVSPEMMMVMPGWNPMTLDAFARSEAVKDMETFLAKFDRRAVKVQFSVEVGRPASSIVRVAEETHADLIVMGTHGRRGVERLLMGSVAQEVVAKAPCPVLTMKAAAESAST